MMIISENEKVKLKQTLLHILDEEVLDAISEEVFDLTETSRDREQKIDYIEGMLSLRMHLEDAIDGMVIEDD